MREIVIHLDPVEVLKLGLAAGMEMAFRDSVQVLGKIPEKRPAEFLRVLLSGGSNRDLVTDVPTIVVEAWATKPSRAMELAQRARALMHWFDDINGTPVYNVTEFAGPGDLPDPLSNHARFTATYSVPMRTARVVAIQ